MPETDRRGESAALTESKIWPAACLSRLCTLYDFGADTQRPQTEEILSADSCGSSFKQEAPRPCACVSASAHGGEPLRQASISVATRCPCRAQSRASDSAPRAAAGELPARRVPGAVGTPPGPRGILAEEPCVGVPPLLALANLSPGDRGAAAGGLLHRCSDPETLRRHLPGHPASAGRGRRGPRRRAAPGRLRGRLASSGARQDALRRSRGASLAPRSCSGTAGVLELRVSRRLRHVHEP